MRQRGFTLLEILVVVAVIAILSAALILSAGGTGSERQIEDEAQRLQRVMQLLCDEAVIEGRFAGFGYSARGYSGYDLSPQGWRTTERDGPLHMHLLRSGLLLADAAADEPLPPELPEEPQVLCAPTGELGDHDLLLSALGSDSGWRVALDKSGSSALTPWQRP
jgi:type II secretion system protein H